MGYSTGFVGILEFTKELTPEEKKKLETLLGADCREHPEWEQDEKLYLSYIDLELYEEDGLIWDGSEKTYDLVEKVNLILREMRKDFPEFGLKGYFDAYGDEYGDNWRLKIENGWAVHKQLELVELEGGMCPKCGTDLVHVTMNKS